MSRRHISTTPTFKSWEDVDKALKEIARREILLDEIEGEMNKQIAGMKEVSAQEAKPHQDRIETLGKDIKEFVEVHRDELGNRKTKTLNFGETGFRVSTAITIPTAKEKLAEVIRKLRSRKMDDCVAVKESVNKEALRQYGEKVVTEIGGKWKQTDTFWYEAAREKLEALGAGQ